MIIELKPPRTGQAFEAMRELRPALRSREEFVEHVDQVQRPGGYRLVGSVLEGAPDAAADAVAGFRVSENLAWGRHLYVDDLSTLPSGRRKGRARQLVDWLRAEAARLECQQIHLDSGVGEHRAAAHRLYLNAGFRITSHHFATSL